MLAAALVAASERFFHVPTRVSFLDVFQSCIHLGRDLVELHAPGAGVHPGLEPEAEEFLVFAETSS
jgi:hypothetical protein